MAPTTTLFPGPMRINAMEQADLGAPQRGPSQAEPLRPAYTLRPGFSLTEALIVMVVVSVLAVMIVPNIEIVKYRMDGSVRGYMAAMVAAQRVAVKRQHAVVVVFDTTYRRLRIHEDANNDGRVAAGERVRTVPLDEGVRFGRGPAPARSWGGGAVMFTELSPEGLPVVRFLRNGSASEQGGLYLTSTRSAQGDRYAKDTRALEVDRATGRVSWFYFEPPDWKQGF